MKDIVIVFLIDILFLYTSMFDMQMLQQNSYNDYNHFYHFYLDDIHKNFRIFLIKFLLGIYFLAFTEFNNYIFIFFIIILLILNLASYINYKKHQEKLPLKFTKRMLRISFIDYILFIVLECVLSNFKYAYFIGSSMIYICFNSLILIFAVFILKPIEKMIFNKYKRQAMKKLSMMNDLRVIGITGSYGKTSTKMILDSILKTTFKGFYTPASFNTPNGLLLTINREPTIFNDYFISEMGAKARWEIKELCDLVHPKYGILTKIGPAHLESFKSLENICNTKFELIESLPNDGAAILNKDDDFQKNYKLKNKCKVIWTSIDRKADVMASNIKISSKGTSFDIIFAKENEKIKVNTILLGNKNVYNILEAVALAKHLGVPNKNIIKGVKNIEPIAHRLEIKNLGNVTIIDDAFNSNPEGAKNALDVLSMMEGKKIIITPGMIEMGKEEATLNKTFGKQMADVCDKVYLVGPKQTKPIYDGLIEKKYDKDSIRVCKSFKEAYNEVIRTTGNRKTCILIENDLPDSYMEE